ncbi:MAG: TetR/AcrR family transcriptional regulator [Cellulosilyticaceae bacterium]
MPPKTKITRDMIVDAGFEILRKEGVEKVNARTVSKNLNCSTQPVMYHFKTIQELKKAVYVKADIFHSEYISNIEGASPMEGIGLQYIRFGAKEKHLFRFLFQSNEFCGKSVADLTSGEEVKFILEIISKTRNISIEQAGGIFKSVFLVAHGYASMLANNDMAYDEQTIVSNLDLIVKGTLYALQGGV